jgi:MFS family permease
MKEVVKEEWNIASSGDTATPSSAGSQGSADYRAAFAVALAGWTLDAFDFFLVAFLLTTIGRDFHQSDARIALSLTATLACRPIGAVIFGLLGDRYGRKLPLMLNLALYACVQVLTALAPTFLTFLAARALFGVCMGGQWGLGTTLAMEKVPPRLRGVLSGVLQQGYSAGYLLAGFACALLEPHFGWRSLFYVACIPALATALFLWFCVEESHVWQKTAQSSNSWSTLVKSTVSNWPLLIFFLALHDRHADVFPWNAGYVSNVPAASMGLYAVAEVQPHFGCDGRGDSGWRVLRVPFRQTGTAAFHHPGVWDRNLHRAVVGLCA